MRKNLFIILTILTGLIVSINSCGGPRLGEDLGTLWGKAMSDKAIQLTENTWTEGYINSDGEQWFKFTATASTQYIHASFDMQTNLCVEVYDSDGVRLTISAEPPFTFFHLYSYSLSLKKGKGYFIKVSSFSGSGGTYKIAFNTSWKPPT